MRNNIGLLLTKRAALSPRMEALVEVEAGRRFTYPELNERANRTANALTALGVRKGDRVALLLMNCAEFVESFFALAKLGAITVPLNWRLVPDELAFILADSGATTLIYGAELRDTVATLEERSRKEAASERRTAGDAPVRAAGAKTTAAGADAAGARIAVRTWIQVGGETRDAFARDYAELQGTGASTEPEIAAADEDALYIMYTSGTTGLPKGAVHTHRSVLWACFTIGVTADVRYGDRYGIVLPLFHVGALTPLLGDVHRGMTTVLMRAFDPARTFQTIEGERLTVMLAVPAMLTFMLRFPDRDRYDRSSLRWVMSGAAPVPVTLIEAYAKLGIEVHQVYGLTESCGPACLVSPDDAIAKAGSTGKAFFHTDVRVVDDRGRDVAPGALGEVIIRGQHLMKGYWNRPEATAETIRDGWLYTGDLATIDDEGFVFIADRKKDMIISGGENVYPAEIENVILSHPKVKEVAVIGQASAKWGESPLAIVVKADDALDAADVLEHCDGKLARYKLPKDVRFVDEIPRNPAGKILKRVLRERFPEPARD